MYGFVSLVCPVLSGLLSRLHGSSLPPRKVWDGLAYGALYGLLCYLGGAAWWASCLLVPAVALAKNSPHQAFQFMGLPSIPRHSFYTAILECTPLKFGGYWFCFVGWMMKGFLIAAAPALVLHSWSILIAGTFSSSVAYTIGWKFLYGRWLGATAWGELGTGIIAGFGFSLYFLLKFYYNL